MAFEGIASKLQNVFKKLTGKGRLSEKEVREAMREIKLALLEADVNFRVVKDFVKTVETRAVGTDVLESLTPGQMIIKIVNEELTNLMGSTNAKLDFGPKKPSILPGSIPARVKASCAYCATGPLLPFFNCFMLFDSSGINFLHDMRRHTKERTRSGEFKRQLFLFG